MSNWCWLMQWCFLVLITVLITVSCGNNQAQQTASFDAKSSDSSCRIIQHAMGEICVPKNPKRVVTLSTENLSNAIVLGIKPVGSATSFDTTLPSYLQGKTEGMTTIGTDEQPSIEAIALLKPDLIIGVKSPHEAIYPLLSKIAPTALYDWQSDETWRDQFSFVAEVLGRREAAQQAWTRYYQRIEDLKLALGNKYQNKTISFVYYYFGRLGSDTKNSFIGSILSDVGLKRPPSQAVIAPYGSIEYSEEKLEQIDGDFLFLTAFSDNDEESLKRLLQKPLFKQLKAVQQNHVYFVDKLTWVGWNLFAADAVIDDLYKYLVNTP
ncbi:ABC transporter substrate-binding protein [Gloeocapsa sp. PCC 7428]|uniref:ABC transporter substrate-binding protein n=1 Tax=Gloeocapsa sp. PCC 7428 TaxID=1173026 RepID=UPI0018C8C8F1|nr:iron-siderophore ABC transporter substrate-binding protein [Gloeocapsa sp. PCC 7428]